MPFTAKQRRYFHAAAERGEKGMSSLASEADSYAKAGKERPPVKGIKMARGGWVDDGEMDREQSPHKDMAEHTGDVCMSCGGPVDEHGMHAGGAVVKDGADGYAYGGEMRSRGLGGSGPSEMGGKNDQDAFDGFARALLRRGVRGL